jgi:hypothetical protein
MTWFKVDDGFWRHAKVRRIGKDKVVVEARVAAVGLWTLAGDWSADNEEDGFVPDETVATWDPKHKLAALLVRVGLWRRGEAHGEPGYQFHQWDQRQPTKAEKEVEREAWRVKKAAQRARERGVPTVSPSESPGDTTQESPEIPGSRPVPSRTSPKGEVPPVGADSAAKILAEYIERCVKRPPSRVVGQLAKEIKALLDEGIESNDIRRGISTWMTKGLHPSTLPSVVNEVMNRVAARASPTTNGTDANIAALLGANGASPSTGATILQLPRGES